jgi:hypothetical protein
VRILVLGFPKLIFFSFDSGAHRSTVSLLAVLSLEH